MASNFSRIRPENQFVFLNTGRLFGLQSFSITDNFGAYPLKYIGLGNKGLNQTVNQNQYSELTLNSYLVHDDLLIQQTGDSPINLFILKDKNNINSSYSLLSGYLYSYSNKFSSNQIPQTSATFRFYNSCGYIPTGNLDPYSFSQLTSISSSNETFNEEISNSNYINLTLDEYNTNRVTDFSFNININRLPIYNIGNRYPKRIDLILPINVTCQISFEPDENFTELNDFPNAKTLQNIEVDVFANQTGKLMFNYLFNNMTLISSNPSLSTDGNLVITRQYVGQIFSFSDGTPIIPINSWDFGFVINSPDFLLDWGFVYETPASQLDFGSV